MRCIASAHYVGSSPTGSSTLTNKKQNEPKRNRKPDCVTENQPRRNGKPGGVTACSNAKTRRNNRRNGRRRDGKPNDVTAGSRD